MSHTPGPWKVDELGATHFLETNHWLGIGCKSGTGRVAKVEGWGEESKANASLIAAAPDLLKVLEAIRDELADYYDGAPDSPTRWMAHHINRATAAIAKAAGDLE